MHVVVAFGANVVTGHVTGPTFGSATPTELNDTLPVFVSTNEYAIVDPAVFPVGVPPCLSNVILGVATIVVSVESDAVGAVTPDGGVPVAVAVLATCPESTSA